MRFLRTICWMCALLGMLHVSTPARSQSPDTNTPSPGGTPVQAPAVAAAPVPDQAALKPAELDALVAPIALYPDTLLANVLMASTYPLEVVRAERWVNQNKNLKDDALKAAAEKQPWDASVKSLVAAPAVLQLLNERLDWTQKLGEAFLAQEKDVMDAVQRMRAKAYDRKKLVTTKQQVVSVREEQSRQVIFIDPAEADNLYVPWYEPQVVYGDWPYSDYPAYPYYWGYPGYIGAGVIATGLAFGAAYGLGRWARGGYWGGGGYWGASRVNWGGGAINVNRGARVEHWQHNPAHRGGARYNNAGLQQKFGGANRVGGAGRPGAGIAAGVGAGAIGAGLAARGGRGASVADRSRRAGGMGQVGNRQGRVGSGNRAVSRAGNFRPSAGIRHGGGARFAGGGGRAAAFRGGGGRSFSGGGGGGFRGGGGGRGGGRRSDIELKHDVVLLGRLDNGLGYYRFAYNGSDKAYVGVIAQEVRAVRPDAVTVGRDGYLRVSYERLGLPFQSYDGWVASGSQLPRLADH